jgi:5-methylcytosine-specific restriction endonuclease McrA
MTKLGLLDQATRAALKNIGSAALAQIKMAAPATKPNKSGRRSREEAARFYRSWGWRKLRFQVIRERGAVCEYCGATDDRIVVDHRLPLRIRWDLRMSKENLVVACNTCNMGKSDGPPAEIRRHLDVGGQPR